jgi:muconolactone delta-isomerase
MSQWMNTAEKSIRELIATGTPKRLWDDRPDYRAYVCVYVCSNTALNDLDGQVPETVMTGQQADISQASQRTSKSWGSIWDR